MVKVIQSVLPKLLVPKKSSFVLFSSIGETLRMPFHASVAVAKGAIEGLYKSLMVDYAPKIGLM